MLFSSGRLRELEELYEEISHKIGKINSELLFLKHKVSDLSKELVGMQDRYESVTIKRVLEEIKAAVDKLV